MSASPDDVEKSIGSFRDHEEDEYLAKIYEKNILKINNISNTIKLSQIFGVSSFIIFLVILSIRVCQNFNFSWFILLVPALICLTSYTVLFNMYLKLKDIFDEVEKSKEVEEVSQIGSIITYFSLNAISLNIFAYLILFSLRVENIILSPWNVIAVPLYITLGIALFYWIFIFPAFFQNKLYSEILIIFIYISCIFVFVLLINLKFDQNETKSYYKVFLPLVFALGFHILFIFTTFNDSLKGGVMFKYLCGVSFITLALVSVILTFLKADGITKTYDFWLPVFMFLVGYISYIADTIWNIFVGEKEEEMINEKEIIEKDKETL